MMLTPFFIFYIIGIVLELNQYFPVKIGLFILLYLFVWAISKLLFDDRVMNVMPMAVYLATKVSFYSTFKF